MAIHITKISIPISPKPSLPMLTVGKIWLKKKARTRIEIIVKMITRNIDEAVWHAALTTVQRLLTAFVKIQSSPKQRPPTVVGGGVPVTTFPVTYAHIPTFDVVENVVVWLIDAGILPEACSITTCVLVSFRSRPV